jgi:hypothetical protein
MILCPSLLRNLMPLAGMLLMCLMDAWRFLLLCLRPSPALAAENLFRLLATFGDVVRYYHLGVYY